MVVLNPHKGIVFCFIRMILEIKEKVKMIKIFNSIQIPTSSMFDAAYRGPLI